MIRLQASLLTLPLAAALASTALAQGVELDWKPMVYSDLRFDKAENHTYVEIWRDEIDANNEDFRLNGDFTYAVGNAPATEAHIVVRSKVEDKQAIVTIFNTFKGCSVAAHTATGTTIKRCPAKLAIFQGADVTISSIDKACYVEHAVPQDVDQNQLVASYDSVSRSIRLGVIFEGKIEEPCLITVPVSQQGASP